jgi:hypothetical protein
MIRMSHLHSWYPNRRSNAGQYDVAGQFTNDVAHCPARLYIVKFIAIKPKIFLPITMSATPQHLRICTHIPDTKALLIFI